MGVEVRTLDYSETDTFYELFKMVKKNMALHLSKIPTPISEICKICIHKVQC